MRYKSDGIVVEQQQVAIGPKGNRCPICGRKKLGKQPCQSKLYTQRKDIVALERVLIMLDGMKQPCSGCIVVSYNKALSDVAARVRTMIKRRLL